MLTPIFGPDRRRDHASLGTSVGLQEGRTLGPFLIHSLPTIGSFLRTLRAACPGGLEVPFKLFIHNELQLLEGRYCRDPICIQIASFISYCGLVPAPR
jgi:hypothetical protein